jgi:hypothetical protein
VAFLDTTGELLGKVDFEKSEIIQPQKLVFVCGGKASGVGGAPTSLRELLLQHSAANGQNGKFGGADVLLAEEAMNALANSSFSNLLDLEEYIAAIVDSVILIVESPGSMCELGAFVKTSEIREKLVVILPGDHKNVPSFITKGAVDFLTEHHANAQVLGFHWKVEGGIVSAPEYTISAMQTEIPSAMLQVHKAHSKEIFQSRKLGHLIYLTLAFCHLLRAAKLSDVKACFANAGIPISEKTIKRCIDTLMICKLLKAVEHGKLAYYVARVERMPLEITFKDGTANPDRNTLRWIMRIKQEIEREEQFRIEMFREHQNG